MRDLGPVALTSAALRRFTLTLALLLGSAAPALHGQAAPAVAEPATTVTSLAAAEDRFITTGDLRLRYRELGDRRGETIVLLHGYWGTLLDMRALADSLARDHHVVAYDARGFGKSSAFADPGRYGVNMTDDVARLLDHLDVDRAHVVGFSMGAATAAGFAFRHPSRVRSLVLAAGTYRDAVAVEAMTAPWLTGLEQGQGVRAMLKAIYPSMTDSAATAVSDRVLATNDRLALMAVLRNYPSVLTPDRAPAIRAPAVAMVGTADSLVVDDTRRLAAAWPALETVYLEGVNHGGILRHAELLAAVRKMVATH